MSIFEELGGVYENVGEYQIPSIRIDESPSIGKWGLIRKRYLKEQHPLLFSELLLSEQLYPHLLEIDEACSGRLELLIMQVSARESVTEALKAADQTTSGTPFCVESSYDRSFCRCKQYCSRNNAPLA